LPSAGEITLGKVTICSSRFPSFAECPRRALGKEFFLKKNNFFAECLLGTRQSIFQKKINFFAECLLAGHSAKHFFKKKLNSLPNAFNFFAECLPAGHSAKHFSKKIISLPSASWQGTRQSIFQKKLISLPSASWQGTRQRNSGFFKKNLCLVPFLETLGKATVSL